MGAPKIVHSKGVKYMELLKASQLFQGLNEQALQFVADRINEVFVRSGEPVILQNEVSDDVFIIESGSIEIVTYIPQLKQVNRLAILKAGQHFSEFSVLNRTTKSASGFATEDTHLLRMSGSSFLEVLNRYPVVAKNLVHRLASLNNAVAESKVFVEYFRPESIKVDKKILDILPINMWKRFEALPLAFESGVLTVALKTPYNPQFYENISARIPKGVINVFLIGDSDFEKTSTELRGYYLGEGVNSKQKKKTLSDVGEQSFEDMIKTHHLFTDLPDKLLKQLFPHFKPIQLQPGQVLFQVGQPSSHYFIVEQGKIEISHPLKNTKAYTHVVALERGEGFSELSLLNKTAHKHLAKSIGPSIVRALDFKIFQELMKAPNFLLPLAQDLAKRLHSKNNQIGLKYFEDESKVNFDGIADLIPMSVMKSHKVIPVLCEDNELVLGLVNPESEEIYTLISRYLSGYRVSLQMISQQQFHLWMNKIPEYIKQPEGETTKITHIKTKGKVDPVQELDKIFLESLQNRASDIHFEPGEESVSIRFRVDGVLQERSESLPMEFHRELINRIKILSEMDISNDKSPQDGQLKVKLEGLDFLARVSTIPTKKGEKSVLRVIRSSGGIVPLNMLAPDKRVISVLKEVSQAKQGLFLVTGPTGSGKSTTLYSLLNEINQVGVNIMTVEDPVEKEIVGLNQVQLHPKAGLTFPAALKSFLRQDPDVIMVGEIRDEESAHIVLEAAITGHIVLSTMHTNSSLDTISRLSEFGISPVTIASAMLGCVSQRLLRSICASCTHERSTTEFEKAFFLQNLKGVTPPGTVHEGRGCVRCNGSGYNNRIPVFEIWRSTEDFKFALTQKEEWDHLKEIAEKDGFETILAFGLRMVLNGLTTIEEVKRCLL